MIGEAGESDFLERAITRAYGSLTAPKWDFAFGAMDQEPYRQLRDEISHRFEIRDYTDTNYEVCFAYSFRIERTLTIWLSMVGPYGVLLAQAAPNSPTVTVISDVNECQSSDERWLIDVLSRHGIRVLTVSELERTVSLRLPGDYEDCAEVPVFAALFLNEGDAPWRA